VTNLNVHVCVCVCVCMCVCVCVFATFKTGILLHLLDALQLIYKIYSMGSFFILSFLHLLTCIYIVWATFPLTTLLLGRTYSALLFSNFVEEKT
jgi:hypothetical protein